MRVRTATYQPVSIEVEGFESLNFDYSEDLDPAPIEVYVLEGHRALNLLRDTITGRPCQAFKHGFYVNDVSITVHVLMVYPVEEK